MSRGKTLRQVSYLSGLMVLLLAGASRGEDLAALGSRLDAVLDRLASTGAILHARVIELPSGRELYARRSDEPCVPASNFKLLTSAAGLDIFGQGYIFETRLVMRGDDLWIIGSGDPATGDYRLAKAKGGKPTTMLDEWADALASKGISRIKGDLVYDDTALDEERIHPSWPKHWLLHWYAAPTAGLNFNDNSIDVSVAPTEAGQPIRYEVMPPVRDIEITNECLTADKGEPSISKLPGGNSYRLRGACSQPAELMSKPIEEPGAFFADALRTHLAARGIAIDGRVRREKWTFSEAEARPIACHRTPIEDVLSRINKNSQNLFAECLCKCSGRKYEQARGRNVPGSWESGGQALRAFLRKSGIDDAALVPVDGSGLSPANRTSARMLTDLLTVMSSRPDAETYRNSLTIAGVDGSLRDRMKDLKGRVFGKTGYIGGVSSVSGYLHTRSERRLAFSFVYNKCPSKVGGDEDVKAFTRLQDEACSILGNE